jgi:hypothetical protein
MQVSSRISVSNVEKIGIQQAMGRAIGMQQPCEGHSECFSFTLKATMHKWNSASNTEAKLSILLHQEL